MGQKELYQPILSIQFIDELVYICSTKIKEGTVSLIENKASKIDNSEYLQDRFGTRARLNLNDLLRKRTEEKKVDKKTNLIILSSVTALAAVVLLILSL